MKTLDRSFLTTNNRRKNRIVVIGGGVSGLLISFELHLQGHEVTLIEAKNIGAGSSLRSAACIRQQFTSIDTVKGMRYAVAFYKNWKDLLGTQTTPIIQNGYLFLHGFKKNPRSIEEVIAKQQQVGLKEVQLLDPEGIVDKFPYLEVSGLTHASWCPTDGFLYPSLIVNECADWLRKAGVKILENDPVVDCEKNKNQLVKVITKSKRAISCDIVINSTGAWAPYVSYLLGGASLGITAHKRYLYFWEGKSDFPESDSFQISQQELRKLPMVITPQGAYFRPESEYSHRVMTGWLGHAPDILSPTHEDQDVIEPGFGINNMEDFVWGIRKEIIGFFPDFESLRPYAVTSGYYADTKDKNPIIDYDLKVENLIHVAGFSGHGLMHAPYTAAIVKKLIDEGKRVSSFSIGKYGEVDLNGYSITRSFQKGEDAVI